FETTKPITFPLSSSAIFEPSHKILTSSKLFCMNNSFLIGKSSPISRFQSATRASKYSLFHAVISNTHSPLSLDISTISNIPQEKTPILISHFYTQRMFHKRCDIEKMESLPL